MNRFNRKKLAAETLTVLERGQYESKDGTVVSLRPMMDDSLPKTVHYSPKHLQELKQGQRLVTNERQTVFEVTGETSLEAAQRLVVQEGITHTTCLNFASAKNPGGGFLTGASAQEESLARSSALYPSLVSQKSNYYDINRPTKGGVYTDNLIWSPSIPVFRKNNGDFFAKPYSLNFITTPAVNAGAARKRFKEIDPDTGRNSQRNKNNNGKRNSGGNSNGNYDEEGESIGISVASAEPSSRSGLGGSSDEGKFETYASGIMLRRIDNVLAVAAAKKQKALILGAWGCGAFKNDPESIAKYFGTLLLGPNAKYCNVFERVVFAVLVASTSDQHNLACFKAVFENDNQ